MSYDTDEEQLEQIKYLWKTYGQPILVGVLIILAGIFGYKAWQKNQYETAAAASKIYQDVVDAAIEEGTLSQDNETTVRNLVGILQKKYNNSRYAAMATLFLAQQQVQADELNKAISSFQWILAQKPDTTIETVTRIRLARVLLALPKASKENAQKALDVLASLKLNKKSFIASIESVKGDAYMVLEEQDKARKSYKKALEVAQTEGQTRPLLQLKLDDLAIAPQGS